jgi:hypothetical protein
VAGFPQSSGLTPAVLDVPADAPSAPLVLDDAIEFLLDSLPRQRINEKTGELKRWPITVERLLTGLCAGWPAQWSRWSRAATYRIGVVRKRRRNRVFRELHRLDRDKLNRKIKAADRAIGEFERLAQTTNPNDPSLCKRFGIWDAKSQEPTRPAWSTPAEGAQIRAHWQAEANKRRGQLAMLTMERAQRDEQEARHIERYGYSLIEQAEMLDRADVVLSELRAQRPGRAARLDQAAPVEGTPAHLIAILKQQQGG